MRHSKSELLNEPPHNPRPLSPGAQLRAGLRTLGCGLGFHPLTQVDLSTPGPARRASHGHGHVRSLTAGCTTPRRQRTDMAARGARTRMRLACSALWACRAGHRPPGAFDPPSKPELPVSGDCSFQTYACHCGLGNVPDQHPHADTPARSALGRPPQPDLGHVSDRGSSIDVKVRER